MFAPLRSMTTFSRCANHERKKSRLGWWLKWRQPGTNQFVNRRGVSFADAAIVWMLLIFHDRERVLCYGQVKASIKGEIRAGDVSNALSSRVCSTYLTRVLNISIAGGSRRAT